MDILKIDKNNKAELKELNKIVNKQLENKDWLIPLENTTIDNIENEYCIMYGVYESDKLIATSGLFFDKEDYLEILKLLNIENNKVAEIAYSMTHPSNRGNNLMYSLNSKIVSIAKELNYEYLIATAHPDNIASNKSLIKLGMECKGSYLRYNKYLRNYYILKI